MENSLTISGDNSFLDFLANSRFEYTITDNRVTFPAESATDIRNSLADIFSDFVIKDKEDLILKRIIKSNYKGSSREQKELFCFAKVLANITEKHSLIYDEIIDFLKQNDNFSVDGIINFRLKKYKDTLKDAVDKATSDFSIRREYLGFISILREFLSFQPARETVLHVKPNQNSFVLLNKKLEDVTEKYVDEFKDIRDTLPGDLLISCAISIAPKQIIIHGYFNEDIVDSVYAMALIFDHKLSFCNSCDICKVNS